MQDPYSQIGNMHQFRKVAFLGAIDMGYTSDVSMLKTNILIDQLHSTNRLDLRSRGLSLMRSLF